MNALARGVHYQSESSTRKIIGNGDDTVEDDQFSLCCLCGKSFPSMRSLHTHINLSHEEVADAFEFPSSLNGHSEISSSPEDCVSRMSGAKSNSPKFCERSCSCPVCGETVSGAGKMQSHMDSMHANRPQCDKCLKTFSTLSYLRMHIATVHEGLKAFSCQYCGKSYTQKHSLKKHISTAHTRQSIRGTNDGRVWRRSPSINSHSTPSPTPVIESVQKNKRKLLVDSPISRESTASPSGTADTVSSGEM
ncbi:Zinc finger and BTB domain-containing protein 41 [Fasciola hepatica]|uniref:Zinc finger and BTB domain-containing protein 41 n=1 Tax=Fasciola hepatica TaxID=6192 RepID=A0A4E0RWT2_FASHE|nr:Zinc finger and BTB domain-containing protein 41 [Fasciola hepatica]